MSKLRYILQLIIPYYKYAIGNIIFNITSVLFSVFSLAMLIPVLDVLFNEGTANFSNIHKLEFHFSIDMIKNYFYYYLGNIIQSQGKTKALFIICLTLVVMTTLKNLFAYFGIFFIAKIRNGVVQDLRNKIYSKILTLPLAYFSEERKGNIITKMSSDTQEVEWSILTSIETVFREPISIIVFLSALVYISWELSLFVFVLLPIAGFIIGKIGKNLRKTSIKSKEKLGELLSITEETLSGLRIVKAFNGEQYLTKNFKNKNTSYTNLMISIYRKRDLASPLSEWMGVMVVAGVLLYGGKIVFNGEISASSFIGFLALFSQVITPTKSLSNASYHIQKGIASLDRINNILTAENKIEEIKNAIPLKKFQSKIEYKNVTFRYENKNIIKNLSFTINKGETVAIVGYSGSGKSTIADLLPRFYDIQEGEILIDNINIKNVTLTDLRNQLGIVTQQSILFNDTIKNNIVFGQKKHSMEEIIQASRIANADEFINKMENQYESMVGEGGGKLSGGQRQRVSIARAILKKPPILILDEATASLDTQSERLVQEAIENLFKNKTSLVIAHRLSTIRNADYIIVLDKGEIIEQGKHEELIQLNGVYKKMYELQSFQ